MPQRPKVLFQKALTSGEIAGNSVPPATGPISAYILSTQRVAVVSTIAVTNRAATPSTFYIGIVRAENAALAWDDQWWLYYGCSIPANDTAMLTCGFGLGPGDAIRVWAPNTSIGFSAYGLEDTYAGEP